MKEQNGKIFTKWWFWVIVIIVVIAVFGGDSSTNNQIQKVGDINDDKTIETNAKEDEKVYGLNEELSVNKNGREYTLIITGITEVQERNQFSDKNPAQVFLIDYTYKHIVFIM